MSGTDKAPSLDLMVNVVKTAVGRARRVYDTVSQFPEDPGLYEVGTGPDAGDVYERVTQAGALIPKPDLKTVAGGKVAELETLLDVTVPERLQELADIEADIAQTQAEMGLAAVPNEAALTGKPAGGYRVLGTNERVYWSGTAITARAPMAASVIATVGRTDTAATLAGLRGSITGQGISTAGYAAVGDGGGGEWYWDAASTATHDAVLTVQPTGLSGAGRWRRRLEAAVNVRWYGAVGNGNYTDSAGRWYVDAGLTIPAHDDTAAINAALATKRPVLIPPSDAGKYVVSGTLRPVQNKQIIGHGARIVLDRTGTFDPIKRYPASLGNTAFFVLLDTYSMDQIIIDGLRIEMNRAPNVCTLGGSQMLDAAAVTYQPLHRFLKVVATGLHSQAWYMYGTTAEAGVPSGNFVGTVFDGCECAEGNGFRFPIAQDDVLMLNTRIRSVPSGGTGISWQGQNLNAVNTYLSGVTGATLIDLKGPVWNASFTGTFFEGLDPATDNPLPVKFSPQANVFTIQAMFDGVTVNTRDSASVPWFDLSLSKADQLTIRGLVNLDNVYARPNTRVVKYAYNQNEAQSNTVDIEYAHAWTDRLVQFPADGGVESWHRNNRSITRVSTRTRTGAYYGTQLQDALEMDRPQQRITINAGGGDYYLDGNGCAGALFTTPGAADYEVRALITDAASAAGRLFRVTNSPSSAGNVTLKATASGFSLRTGTFYSLRPGQSSVFACNGTQYVQVPDGLDRSETVASLPGANVLTWGRMVRIPADGTLPERVYRNVQDEAGNYAWEQVQKPWQNITLPAGGGGYTFRPDVYRGAIVTCTTGAEFTANSAPAAAVGSEWVIRNSATSTAKLTVRGTASGFSLRTGTFLDLHPGQSTRFIANGTQWVQALEDSDRPEQVTALPALSAIQRGKIFVVQGDGSSTPDRAWMAVQQAAGTYVWAELRPAGGGRTAAVTGNYTATLMDDVLLVDASAGNVTVTLPNATPARLQRITIKNISSNSMHAVTVARAGSDLIDGATSLAVTRYNAVTVYAQNSAWWVI